VIAGRNASDASVVPSSVNADPLPVTIDPNGNLTQKVEGADTWIYEWNAENQLKRVLKNSVEQARFAYDPLGRRVEMVAGAVTTSWAYDGRAILREQKGVAVRHYVHGPGIDQPMAVEEAGVTVFFHADAISSVVRTTTSGGVVTAGYRYDAFGEYEAGPATGGFAFTGRERDAETGLLYYRARFYSPKDARFLSPDPQGFKDGPNLYAYVRGNPAKFIDPLGLAACCDCPSQEWYLHGGLTFSASFLMGFSGGFGMMECKDNPTITRPVIIRCTSFGLQLGAGVSFDYQVGGPPSLTGVCHLNPFEPPSSKGWIGSGGPFTVSTDTEGLTKNFSLGLNPGAGFAYQECFIFPD
jgi:RHS repeat-associated protein